MIQKHPTSRASLVLSLSIYTALILSPIKLAAITAPTGSTNSTTVTSETRMIEEHPRSADFFQKIDEALKQIDGSFAVRQTIVSALESLSFLAYSPQMQQLLWSKLGVTGDAIVDWALENPNHVVNITAAHVGTQIAEKVALSLTADLITDSLFAHKPISDLPASWHDPLKALMRSTIVEAYSALRAYQDPSKLVGLMVGRIYDMVEIYQASRGLARAVDEGLVATALGIEIAAQLTVELPHRQEVADQVMADLQGNLRDLVGRDDEASVNKIVELTYRALVVQRHGEIDSARALVRDIQRIGRTSGNIHPFSLLTKPVDYFTALGRLGVDTPQRAAEIMISVTSLRHLGSNGSTVAQVTPLTVATSGTGSGIVTSVPLGIDCGDTCSHAFAIDTTVTLRAMPLSNSRFSGWGGVCSGLGDCVVTTKGAANVEARFSATDLSVAFDLPERTPSVLIGRNDTGIILCGVEPKGIQPCVGTEPWGQDAHYGRDSMALGATLSKTGGGDAGFDFTKISNTGGELPLSATLGRGPNDWACTRDNATGLIWEVKTTEAGDPRDQSHVYTWFDSNSPDGAPGARSGHCLLFACDTEGFVEAVNRMGLCGASDWRLPTVRELREILHFGRYRPAIDPDFFPNTKNSSYWTATPYARRSNKTWVVSLFKGSTGGADRMATSLIRLVRDSTGLSPLKACRSGPNDNQSDDFLGHGDGTVTDRRTGLMWKQCAEGLNAPECTITPRSEGMARLAELAKENPAIRGRLHGQLSGYPATFTWAQALAQAEASTFAGYDDWRLPNVKELASLLDECRAFPAINAHVFPNALSHWEPGSYYWSSSPDLEGGLFKEKAWRINFADGDISTNQRRAKSRVRLVRNDE
jgi:hypothetical protein